MKIVDTDSRDWKELAETCPFATYFHHPSWFALLGDVFPKWTALALISRESSTGGRVLLPLMAEGLNSRASTVTLRSSALYTYGGPIADPCVSPENRARYVRTMIGAPSLRAEYAEIYGNPYTDIPLPSGFSSREITTHIVKLAPNSAEMRTRYSTIQRRGLKRCDKAGVTVRLAYSQSDWKEYFRCYEESLARWDDRATSRYPWELFGRLRQEPIDRVNLWIAEAGRKILAGAVVFLLGSRAYYWHGAMAADAGKIMPSRKLWDCAFERYGDARLEVVDMLSSGGHEGVIRFKESLGASPVTFRATSWRAGVIRRGALKIVARTIGIMDHS